MNLSLIIPMRNEAENVAPLAAAVTSAFAGIPEIEVYEVLCVDDGSSDETANRVRALADGRFRVISLDRGYGQTAAIAAGVSQARFDMVGIMDADLQTDPGDFARLISVLEEGYQCVNGARVARRDNWKRRLSTAVARRVRRTVLGDSFHDISCPLKLMEKRCLENLTFFDSFHRYLPHIVALRGFRVAEVPVGHRPRTAGKSHYGVLDRLFIGIGSLLVVRWMGRHLTRYRLKEEVPR